MTLQRPTTPRPPRYSMDVAPRSLCVVFLTVLNRVQNGVENDRWRKRREKRSSPLANACDDGPEVISYTSYRGIIFSYIPIFTCSRNSKTTLGYCQSRITNGTGPVFHCSIHSMTVPSMPTMTLYPTASTLKFQSFQICSAE